MISLFNRVLNVFYYLGLVIVYGSLKIVVNPVHYIINSKLMHLYIKGAFVFWILIFIQKIIGG